jgi:hypothetical protein
MRECESEVTRRREKEELLPYAAECVSWELSDPPSSCIYCNPFSTSNTLTLSRGCRRFCRTTLNIVSVCFTSYEQISVHYRSESPIIGIRAYGLKGCLILLKNESCQNYVLTIPLCRGGRDEATVENRVEI